MRACVALFPGSAAASALLRHEFEENKSSSPEIGGKGPRVPKRELDRVLDELTALICFNFKGSTVFFCNEDHSFNN